MSEVVPVPQTRRKWLRRIRNVALVALVVVVAAWKLMPANVVRSPILLERGNDAQLHEQSPRSSGNVLRIGAHAGALKSQNNMTAAASESHSSPAYLLDRSLIIFNESKHLLMERVGTELLETLKTDNQFDRLEYYPSGHLPKPGALAAEMVIRLDVVSIAETGITTQDLKATVTASLGSSYAASNFHVHDHLSPPTVDHNSQITIEHQSSLTGVESSSARYVLQGKNIAAQLAKSVADRLKSLRTKYSPMPNLPQSLRPAFQATPDFSFVKRLNANVRSSSHGLMFCNETFWQFDSSEEIEPLLSRVRDELKETGWQLGQTDAGQSTQPHLRADRGAEIVEIFSINRGSTLSAPQEKSVPIHYAIRYLHRMDAGQLQAAVAEMLSLPKPDTDSLLLARRFGNPEQQAQIIEQIERNPPLSVDAWLAVAEAYGSRQDTDACRNALVRATILLQTVVNTSDYEQRIKNLATQQKIPETQLKQSDPEILKELGIVELDADGDVREIDIAANGAASFRLAGELKGNPIITVRIQTDGSPKSNARSTVTILEASDGMRSWSSQSMTGEARINHQTSVDGKPIFILIQRAQNDLFRISAKVGSTP